MTLYSIEEIVDDFRQGKMVIMMDDEDRENEGDLIMAAEQVRPEDINFMATHARGLICLTLSQERCKTLDLPLMVRDNMSTNTTNFTVSIEASTGVSTGISAEDRARTIRAAVAKDAQAGDIVQPGHVFPLMCQPGGVLSRSGHTEAGSDLARLAGFEPASVIVEIMNSDGSMARRPDLEAFAKEHDIKIGTIADLINYRSINERTVEPISERKVDTAYGDFTLKTYINNALNERHFALVKGDIDAEDPTLVRVHVGHTARDVFTICPEHVVSVGWDFRAAMQRISEEGKGVLVYICHTETTREIDESIDWLLSRKSGGRLNQNVEHKLVGTGSQILADLGVKKMRLMGKPHKYAAISGFDLDIVEYVHNENN